LKVGDEFSYITYLLRRCFVRQCVAVHCAWGRGRTGTMMACYLAQRRHLSADDAIAEIRQMRPGSVDSAKQENAVHLYVQSLDKK